MSIWGDIRELWRGRHRLHDIVGINRRNVELVYAYNRRKDYPLVDDKILAFNGNGEAFWFQIRRRQGS